MSSFPYKYNKPIYLETITRPVQYIGYNEAGEATGISSTGNNDQNSVSFNQYETTNYNQITNNDQTITTGQMQPFLPFGDQNQVAQNQIINSVNYNNQVNNNFVEYPVANVNATNYYSQQGSQVIGKSQNLNQVNVNPTNNVINNNPMKVSSSGFSVDFSLANDKSRANQINPLDSYVSKDLNVLDSINTVNSINHNEENRLSTVEEKNESPSNSPRRSKKITTSEPPSPILISKHENGNLQKTKNFQDILTQDEKILLNNRKGAKEDFNIKSHYDLNLTKEPFGFNYKKVHKVGTPLLSHFEMPQNYEYRSPLLSQNGKYLACIGHGPEDFVYVWDMSDLYWYKYKFSSSRVDGISFTPDSSSIIIVFRYSNPIMYNLSNGKKILEFEKNGEENNREGFQCTYTIMGNHFAYTTVKSFTLWSLRTGEIKQQILDNSPIKIISNEDLICINSDLNVNVKKISTQENLLSFEIKGIDSPSEILDARIKTDMSAFIYIIKEGIIKYLIEDKEYKGIQKFLCGVKP